MGGVAGRGGGKRGIKTQTKREFEMAGRRSFPHFRAGCLRVVPAF